MPASDGPPLDTVSYTFTLKQLGEAKYQTKSATGCRHHSPIPKEHWALPSAGNYAVLVPWCHLDWCSSARSVAQGVSVSIDHVLVLDKVAGHQSTFALETLASIIVQRVKSDLFGRAATQRCRDRLHLREEWGRGRALPIGVDQPQRQDGCNQFNATQERSTS